MSANKGYMTGLNLGGWLSQYNSEFSSAQAKQHFETYITEEDIKLIASWGFDHVRLPVDCRTLLEEDGFPYVDRAIYWGNMHGVNVIIDLHDAPGYTFIKNDNILFDSAQCQSKLIELWSAIAERYHSLGQNVRYELLNEVKDNTPDRWNMLSERLIRAIRVVDAEHHIIVGGINMNNIRELESIRRFHDDKIVYTFHMYDPFLFTHQRASWVPLFEYMDRQLPYPCEKEEYNKFIIATASIFEKIGGETYKAMAQASPEEAFVSTDVNKEYMRGVFIPAITFLHETGLPIYCGEFGVIDHVDIESRTNYVGDIGELCVEYGIGRAMWNYKELGFKLVDTERNLINEELLCATSKRAEN